MVGKNRTEWCAGRLEDDSRGAFATTERRVSPLSGWMRRSTFPARVSMLACSAYSLKGVALQLARCETAAESFCMTTGSLNHRGLPRCNNNPPPMGPSAPHSCTCAALHFSVLPNPLDASGRS